MNATHQGFPAPAELVLQHFRALNPLLFQFFSLTHFSLRVFLLSSQFTVPDLLIAKRLPFFVNVLSLFPASHFFFFTKAKGIESVCSRIRIMVT